MREMPPPSPAVVVGIDGSRGAVDAALWAVDEAVERDVPLRLVCAVEPPATSAADSRSLAHALTTAEAAVRHAVMAVESLDRPVKVEIEIIQDRPVTALLASSQGAAMICVGAVGINRATGKRLGSTVSALLARTHCPIAVIRGNAEPRRQPGWVVAECGTSVDGAAALAHAVDEARLRRAPLRVLATWRPGFHDTGAFTDGNRQAKAALERSLSRHRRMNPDVDIHAVAVPGDPINYLARHADEIQLIVVNHRPTGRWSELTGRDASATLTDLNCSVLISERHSGL